MFGFSDESFYDCEVQRIEAEIVVSRQISGYVYQRLSALEATCREIRFSTAPSE